MEHEQGTSYLSHMHQTLPLIHLVVHHTFPRGKGEKKKSLWKEHVFYFFELCSTCITFSPEMDLSDILQNGKQAILFALLACTQKRGN